MAEPFYIIDNAKFEMVNSKYAMTTICNILMNLVVLENKVVEDAHIFYHLLKFIMNTLPSLENNGEVRYQVSAAPHSLSLLLLSYHIELLLQVLVLYGNLGVLGLLILQKHSRRPKSTDYSIFRFIQVSQSVKISNYFQLSQLSIFRAGRGEVPLGRSQLRGGPGGGGAGGLHSLY